MREDFSLILFMLEVNTTLTEFPNFWVTHLCKRTVSKTSSCRDYFKHYPTRLLSENPSIYFIFSQGDVTSCLWCYWFKWKGRLCYQGKLSHPGARHPIGMCIQPACCETYRFPVRPFPHPSLRWAIDCACFPDRRTRAKTWRSSCGRCLAWTSSWVCCTRNTGKCTSASYGREAGSKAQASPEPIQGQKTL